ncbi:mechanosensitive ion channel family protein [Sporolactobacillus shoreicorticis]|uniref:Mechanosensitive ion channel family protein n=1 Tax=Sporolactobacillus shoreicorticis TaxID=1923877 RepID=A0ABW5RZM5_9BACL|nr:mechanosensitive ion channel family protein [Sporolactobacillus shoreicorticis]MCO7126803.1 mechanosensitive ion channel family protein [Sporolactobacillus shoreicorticis]
MEQLNWILKITWLDGLISIGIFAVFFLVRELFSKYFLKLVSRLSKLSKTPVDDALIGAFRKPVAFILLFAGIYLALMYLPMPHQWKSIATLLFKSSAIFSIGWGFYIFSDAIGIFFHHMGNRYDLQFNTIVIPFLAKIMKFIVVVFTIVMILDQWNYHVTGLITGLGIGGLAIAMAAKDTLSNLFGGFVIITDAPFTIGDLIHTGSIEGFVEDINFRSTRIRTLDQAIVTVPNSTLANSPITNLSKMDKRRISFNLPLDLETTNEQMKRCLGQIRQMLMHDPEVYEERKFIYLDKITSSSMNLLVDFYIKSIDVGEWLKEKEKYTYAVLEILQNEGVELATSRSLMVIPPQHSNQDPAGSSDENNQSDLEQKSRLRE